MYFRTNPNEKQELINGIWFEDKPYDNLIEGIRFDDCQFQEYIPTSTNGCHLGEEKMSNSGSHMTIIEYFSYSNITVKFVSTLSTGETRTYIRYNQNYVNFKKGELRSPYDCNVCGIGYMGDGPYNSKNSPKFYDHWTNMITRCYNPKSWETRPRYKGCSVHPYFHNFQNFCYWCEQNYYEVDGYETMCLDKDILLTNNKVYGPNTCIFVPQTINKLFTYNQDNGKIGIPPGLTYIPERDVYTVSCGIHKKRKFLGNYKDKDEAFSVYKEAKEKEIKRVAEEYKGKIPDILYCTMMRYKVHYNR